MNKIVHTIFLALSCGVLQASEHARKVTTFIYSHGFTSCKAKANSYIQARIIPETTRKFNYSDAYLSWEPSHGYGVALDFWNSCIGQNSDIKKLACEVDQYSGPIVLAGESRGASTILNYLGSEYAKSDRIAAAILDSPFDMVKSVLAHRLKLLGLKDVLSPEAVERAAPYFCWNYDPNGIQPIKSVALIDHEIPIFMVCSAEDAIVPHSSGLALYKEMLRSGHKKAYLLMLERGKHGWIMQGPQGDLYRKVVHAFYESNGIDSGLESSPGGHDLLQDYCQPTLEQLEQPDFMSLLAS